MRLIRWSDKTRNGAITSPVRSDPFESLLAENPFESPFDRAFRGQETWPVVDVLEKGGDIFIRAELPGMTQKEFDIKLTGNVITISGEKKVDTPNSFRRKESWYGRFMRSFTLPETIDPDRIKAEFKDGILTIQIPHNEAGKPRAIPVRVE